MKLIKIYACSAGYEGDPFFVDVTSDQKPILHIGGAWVFNNSNDSDAAAKFCKKGVKFAPFFADSDPRCSVSSSAHRPVSGFTLGIMTNITTQAHSTEIIYVQSYIRLCI
jgi:hypothetical protein